MRRGDDIRIWIALFTMRVQLELIDSPSYRVVTNPALQEHGTNRDKRSGHKTNGFMISRFLTRKTPEADGDIWQLPYCNNLSWTQSHNEVTVKFELERRPSNSEK